MHTEWDNITNVKVKYYLKHCPYFASTVGFVQLFSAHCPVICVKSHTRGDYVYHTGLMDKRINSNQNPLHTGSKYIDTLYNPSISPRLYQSSANRGLRV